MTTSQTEARAIINSVDWSVGTTHDQLVDLIATAIAAKDVELAGALEASERFSIAWRDAENRAERAEAQLAEANKEQAASSFAQIDAAARYLRETLQAWKRLTPWEMTPNVSKKKWRVLAEGALRAAREAQEGRI